VNAQNKFGDTALIAASRAGDTAVCKLLLSAGADTRLRNSSRKTAGEIAKMRGFAEVKSLLESA